MTATLIDRISSNDGTIENAVAGVFWGNGKGEGIFDGADEFVNVGPFANIIPDMTTDVSVDFWIRTTVVDNSAPRIFSGIRASGATVFQIMMERSASNKIEMLLRDEGGDIVQVRTATQINDGNWHYLLFTKSGNSASDIALYLDGAVESLITVLDQNFDNPNEAFDIYIGATNNSGTPALFLAGSIRSFRVYDRALMVAEGQQNYEAERHVHGI